VRYQSHLLLLYWSLNFFQQGEEQGVIGSEPPTYVKANPTARQQDNEVAEKV
jgi:hypothetical protein